MEKNPLRKKILVGLFVLGLTGAVYLAYCLVVYPVRAQIGHHHIQYILNFPKTGAVLSVIFYVIPILVSPFVSSVKRMAVLGITVIITFVVAKMIYDDYFISVWCFFAAVVSILIIWIEWSIARRVRRKRQKLFNAGL